MRPPESQFRVAAEREPQALAERRQTRAEPAAGRLESDPRVADAQVATPALQTHMDVDSTTVLARINAVAHRVLDQRQQRHRRAPHPLDGRIDPQVERESVGHPHLHHLEVSPHQVDLLPHGRRWVVEARHRRPQVRDQAPQHRRGLRGPGVHQRLNVGECVEQEVWFDLRLQQSQTGVDRLALQLAALEIERERLGPCETRRAAAAWASAIHGAKKTPMKVNIM